MKEMETERPEVATNPAPLWKKLLLLLGLFLASIALTAGACGGSDNSSGSNQVKRLLTKKKYRIQIDTIEESRDKISVKVTVVWLGPPPPPSEVRLTWNPPQNSTNKSWEGEQPDSLDEFHHEIGWALPLNPATGRTAPLTLSYDPICPTWRGTDAYAATETFEAMDGSDNWGNTSITHQLAERPQASVLAPSAPAGERSEALVKMSLPQLADYYLWQARLWLFASETMMTTSLCQEWMDRLQTEPFFIAVRFPVQPPTLASTDPYSLPVVFDEELAPTLALMDTSPGNFGPVFTASLEYKPRYFSFLENELPSAPGEHWLALGVVPTPTLACPAGIALEPDDWAFRSKIHLDLGGIKDTCADCVLPFYYCYEGQESPIASALLSDLLAGAASVSSHQGWGITCLGPQPFRLLGDDLPALPPPFELHGSNTAVVTTTRTISFHHPLQNLGTEPVTVSLDHTSALSIPWTIYVGNDDEPQSPLTGPLALTETTPVYYSIWMVAQVSTEELSGTETLLITATDVTSDARHSWTSDLLWVGDWVAPPPLPGPRYHVYLPLILH